MHDDMNILHLVAGKLSGGAARGASGLHEGLRSIDVDSVLMCTDPQARGDNIISVGRPIVGQGMSRLRMYCDQLPIKRYKNRQHHLFSPSIFGFDFTRTEAYRRCDLVNLHWINNGFVSVRTLSKVDKPMVWTMRDMRPFTGGCHYSLDCRNYRTGCGACPQLGSSSAEDLSRKIYRRNRRFIPPNVCMVGISEWVSACARESELFERFDVRTILNCVNTNAFYHVDQAKARHRLSLPADASIVATGAITLSDGYKGRQFLPPITELCRENGWLHCHFGRWPASEEDEPGIRFFGYVNDDTVLRDIYAAADVFVLTSTQEAFGKTAAEALCCGTPAVAFDGTGARDYIQPNQNGYLVAAREVDDLCDTVRRVLQEKEIWLERSETISKNSVELLSIERIARDYVSLYSELLVG